MLTRTLACAGAAAGLLLACLAPARAQEPPLTTSPHDKSPTYGHSSQGEAFDEGPRQKAFLMKGMAKIVFPVTTRSSQAQKFFEQGVAQLHAYWYFEAERSFRQAAALDPDCAMAYWGMAMANSNVVFNEARAKGFIEQAMKRRAKASAREKLWIENLNGFLNADPNLKDRDKTRRKAYIAGLQKLVNDYPNELEAKAFLAHQWLEHNDLAPSSKREDIDKLMN